MAGSRRPSDLLGDDDDLAQRISALERNGFIEQRRLIGAVGQPAFSNSWTNYGGVEIVANFYKADGRVYLAGVVKSGTVGLTMFQLPAGYLPGGSVRFAVVSNGAFGYLSVDGSGNVSLASGSNVFVDLSPVHFQASA